VIRTVVLDLDGPVLDGRERHYTCYREILEEHGHVCLPPERYWALKRDRAGPGVQLAASGAETLEPVFRSEWLARIESPRLLALDRVQPGASRKLEAWKRRGLRAVLATQRRERDALRDQLERLCLTGAFDSVVVCETSDKAAAVRRACPELDASTCVWIGDTEVDIDAARALGCPAWVVTCGLRSEAFLAARGPSRVFEDLAAIDL
jgi:phosphoglycolate phosphatase